ncbi:MAG: ribosome recycling factor [Candidatus Komeilibacteria bacterium]
MSEEYLADITQQNNKVIEYLQGEFKNIKTGRATPSLVENVNIESYGVQMPLLQLASVTAPEPNVLMVKPWDKNNAKEINKALSNSDLGASVSMDDDMIILRFSSITEERRLELVKKIKEKAEQARIKVRGNRDKAREKATEDAKNKEISEDEKYTRFDSIDKLTKDTNDKIKDLADGKEKEIMSI